ncbi:hypothetical protein Back11_63120 [Paenibacillus baekrokdamisoli]|uniref:Phosphodiester glycosidase domain-containing protein n=1 Tax=Paenibacillus baekrokdamisoli TaxID=1712516 RepID=A0A3G9J1A9_9BACL|nr:phosphodiester glycosidase family protein [Paenibacillus baekrokdamisoli]MBB3069460.1 exopolysaccharide biosynthesis protein [Paenibacillus baekrokdamisoli]BBH24967.1 hypothetical protein Back11_63120 [Paenibacillus baekrokdamisoli]
MRKVNLKIIGLSAALLAIVASSTVVMASGLTNDTTSTIKVNQQEPVTLTYPSAIIEMNIGSQLRIGNKLTISQPVALAYRTGNPAIVKVNTNGVLMPVSVGATTVTIQVSSDSYSGTLKLPVRVAAAAPLKLSFAPKHEVRKVTAGGKSYTVQTIILPKGMPVTMGYGNRKVGTTQSLAGIAQSYNADFAINGAFFDAYSGIPDPYGNLISNGIVEHIGNRGTTIGFKWDGSVVMDSLRIGVAGNVEGSKRSSSWYAYFINHQPVDGGTAATLFTPMRGDKLGFKAGNAIIVQNGVVTRIRQGEDVAIPKDGFVLVFQGGEKGQANRFAVGDKVSYKVNYTDSNGKELDWSQVHTAVGAGPRLVQNGVLSLNATEEGFKDPKILTGGGARSGIAIRKDGSIMLATVPGATMKQWAQIMVQLGAQQAMNLDGGASSGLWFKGASVTSAGRELSNVLLFGERLKW